MYNDPRTKRVIGLTPLVAPQYPRRRFDGKMVMDSEPPAYVVLVTETIYGIDENVELTATKVHNLKLRYLDP